LAHSPNKTTRLEEGVATLFGLDNTLIKPARAALEESRLDAARALYLADVRCLLTISADAIHRLRTKSIKFEDIQATDIEALGASSALATRLCLPTKP
jgi:hypothetical protein